MEYPRLEALHKLNEEDVDSLEIVETESIEAALQNFLNTNCRDNSEEARHIAEEMIRNYWEDPSDIEDLAYDMDRWEYIDVEDPWSYLQGRDIWNFNDAINDGECYDITGIACYYLNDEVFDILRKYTEKIIDKQ